MDRRSFLGALTTFLATVGIAEAISPEYPSIDRKKELNAQYGPFKKPERVYSLVYLYALGDRLAIDLINMGYDATPYVTGLPHEYKGRRLELALKRIRNICLNDGVIFHIEQFVKSTEHAAPIPMQAIMYCDKYTVVGPNSERVVFKDKIDRIDI